MSARRTNVLETLIDGAVAGAVATSVMDPATTYLYDHEANPAREAEDGARGNTTAYGVAADGAARLLRGTRLNDEQREQYGTAIHFALYLTPGPTEFPWRAHARGLAGHLVLGTVAEAALAAVAA